MTVADTDVLIDYLAGQGEAAAVDGLLRRGALATTVISRFELLSGAKSTRQKNEVSALLAAVPSLSLDAPAADTASEIRRSLERSGNSIGMADSLIAGIAVTAGLPLLTRNRRHFERIPGLQLA
jgi:predicted nucleic acid-binding protein